LIVPAPIKRAYICDLLPAVSAVRRCLEGGFRVYLIQWEPPGAKAQASGLAYYADHAILDCLNAIEAATGQRRVVLVGHSLGGTLAAIFAALHPDRVRGLVLVEAPLSFGAGVSAFDPVVRASAPASGTDSIGNVPGSLIDVLAMTASPTTFIWARHLDFLLSWFDPQALHVHLLVERWALDEMALTRRLFVETLDWLYREDRFMQQKLVVAGRLARPQSIDAPIASVTAPASRVVLPAAILPFHEAVASTDTEVFWYGGDHGVALQHVGPLVGRQAHRQLWPRIIRWLTEHTAGH
jgi:polyhydroxyalkanoate synthase